MKLTYTILENQLLKYYLEKLDIQGKLLANIKTQGDLRVNGEHVTVRYELQVGDILEIVFPQETRGEQMDPVKMDLDIVYEDEYLLVINKPPHIPCIPDHRYHVSLANGILYYYDQIHLDSTVHFVNRLDKETSGLLIVAKYRYIHHLLSGNHINRKYYALVDGIIDHDLSIYKRIGRNGLNVRRIICEDGKDALTDVRVIKHKENQTLVECTLHTGRTHQIRVHLSSISHPLSGDTLYGSTTGDTYYLHSYYLQFIHPITHQKIELIKEREIL